MNQTMRFGRRLALPSTRQILHELRVFSLREEARGQAASAQAVPGVDPAPALVPAEKLGPVSA